MARQRIAVIAPPWYPVPPSGYGGIELVVDLLVRELRRRNLDVTLFAPEGSGHDAIELAPAEWSADLGRPRHIAREVTYLSRVVSRLRRRGADIVHDHSGGMSGLVAGLLDLPAIHTVHGHLDESQRTMYAEVGRRLGLVAISNAQRASAPDLNWVGTVHNSVDIDALQTGDVGDKEGYLLVLARISPQKGQHIALEVARRTGRRIVFAGKVGADVGDRAYFEEVLAPFIDDDQVVYLHNVAGVEKARLLARADALLAPLQWAEPFGLAMAEAMASGTPTIAFSRGAAPELIDHGVTGLLCDDADGMVDSIGLLADIDVRRCAQIARKRFSPATMADGYLAQYTAALEGSMEPLITALPTALASGGRAS